MLVLGSGLAGEANYPGDIIMHGVFFATSSFQRFQVAGKQSQLSCAHLQSLSFYDCA